jgi:hypothetical protein
MKHRSEKELLDRTIAGLRGVKSQLDRFLERGRAQAHKGMWEASPGLWISNDFKSSDEAMQWLRTLLNFDSIRENPCPSVAEKPSV